MKKSTVATILVLGLIFTQLFASTSSNMAKGQTTTTPAIGSITNFTLIPGTGFNLIFSISNFFLHLHNAQRNPHNLPGDRTQLAYITAQINPATVAAPGTAIGVATAYDTCGNSWDISTQAVWSIPQGGDGGTWNQNVYNSNTAGTYTIQATYRCKTATTTLKVIHSTDQTHLDHITIAPKTTSVNAGVPQTYITTAYDTCGNSWIVNADYTSPNTKVGISDNQAYSNTAGNYIITASYGDKSDTATLTVTGHLPKIVAITVAPKTASIAAGTSQAYTAYASDGYNTWDATDQVVWSIDSAAGGSWNQNTGTYTSAKAGNWTVTANSDSCISDTAALTVNANPAQLNHITITPKTISVGAGIPQNYTATAYDLNGNSLGDVTATSTFTAPGSSVTANTVVANNAGVYTVTAAYRGLTDTATLISTGYTASFSETGLPTGTSWTVTLGGKNYTSTTNTLTISGLSAQNYTWTTTSNPQNAYTRYVTAQTAGTLNVPSQLIQTLSFKTEYMVIYTAMGNNSAVSTPANEWVITGGQATGTFPNQTISTNQDSRCNFLSDNRSRTISEPTTIAANYQTQYTLTVTSTHGTARGADWYNSGTTATVTIDNPISSGPAGTRYVFVAWSGDAQGTSLSSNITMDGPKTANTIWDTQYLVTYSSAGNAIPLNVPPNEWLLAGGVPKGRFLSSAVNSANDTQCIFQSDNRPAVITAPTTITGRYETQYKVTFNQKGIASDVKETILTIQGTPRTWDQLPITTWVTAGSTIDFLYNGQVHTGNSSKSYALIGVNANSHITVNQPMLIEGTYTEQIGSIFYAALVVALFLLAALPTIAVTSRYMDRRKKKLMNKTVSR